MNQPAVPLPGPPRPGPVAHPQVPEDPLDVLEQGDAEQPAAEPPRDSVPAPQGEFDADQLEQDLTELSALHERLAARLAAADS